jgi:DNA invertase Pin-like site-specific DNA recombinase
MTSAVVYARISQDRSGEQVGVDRQLAACEQHIKDNGWTLAAVYCDNDRSAMKGRRPDFERMLAELGGVDVIVVWSADRLYRRLKDLERLVDRLGRTRVEALHSGEINLSSADGRAVARILGSLAQRESEKMGERVSAAYQQRAMAGGWSGGPRRLGYTIDCDGIVDWEADLIRWAYRHIDSGGSINSVKRRWAEAGLKGPLGGAIQSGGVRNTLLRPRNAGLAVYRGELVGETTSPAIIDVDTWRRVEAVLRSNPGPGSTEKTLLSGIAVCGECGGPVRAMVRHWKGKPSQPAYRCHVRYCASRRRDTLDLFVSEAVLTVLESEGPRILAAMRPAGAVDPAAHLRAELDALGRLVAERKLTAVAYAAAAEPLSRAIEAAGSAPSHAGGPGAEAAGVLAAPDIRAAWDAAPIKVRRQLVTAVVAKVVVPKHPGQVRIEWAGREDAAQGNQP